MTPLRQLSRAVAMLGIAIAMLAALAPDAGAARGDRLRSAFAAATSDQSLSFSGRQFELRRAQPGLRLDDGPDGPDGHPIPPGTTNLPAAPHAKAAAPASIAEAAPPARRRHSPCRARAPPQA
ncbi:hypothetical protein ACFQ1E_01225 [Sphingomonas canadensis]|uniref:Uncharacterized protein n=1 Tax=Sphingomonas canadensis TaxID=1219257 RepID=A0ABW3H0J5_9SPHN|nr:hypothetical protein [Sphingomonas canadensis]MCW3835137.1 hypothetical protein [Sphingomonas canadensis]